ncbi:hypothetical protein I4U23_016280 [Adineta vaga]|nr:hypothetical protein I4U23_016280 [Adineta vaga]
MCSKYSINRLMTFMQSPTPTPQDGANILRSDNPVKLCYKHGYSPSDHGTPVKIGGFVIRVDASQHMCSNQQPWFVNDKLAYGYGSMKYYPTSDITYCCICYQLNFMNDLLKEKTMFIQIIDHAEMISDGDQLVDLFIPGSEDRVLECKAQWDSYGPTYEYPSEM